MHSEKRNLPKKMSFACQKSNSEVEQWLCNFNLASRAEVEAWCSSSNAGMLQERLNSLTGMKDSWYPEFIEFLGITDSRVKLICEHDQALAEKAGLAFGIDAVN